MNIKYGQKVDIKDLNEINFDLFLFANNIEKRKLTAYQNINANNSISLAYALCYNENFEEDFEGITNIYVKEISDIFNILENVLSSNQAEFNIYIDYSCMTKPWYYSIINYLANTKLDAQLVNAYFSYTPSIYSEPLPPKQNTKIEPLPGNYKISNHKPKALIVCLGYEQNKAQGIIDQLDPNLTYIFYTDPALDSRFVKQVENNNKDILNLVPDSHIIKYPFSDILQLERELTSLYYLLRNDYNIIIAPLGPKPFTLVSMVLSVIYKEIEIWRVDGGFDINKYEREPIVPHEFIINKITFEKEELIEIVP